jgi:uncharacterized repeat protein (TIGR01451 family)
MRSPVRKLSASLVAALAIVLATAGVVSALSAFEGASFSGVVTSFALADFGAADCTGFTASIDWGDATATSSGSVAAGGLGCQISGSHTYAEDGPYTVSAMATLAATSHTYTAAMAVGENVLTLGVGAPITTFVGTSINPVVAAFTDPGPSDPPGDFTATIDWGDGTTSAGTVSGSAGNYSVSGIHTYTAPLSGGYSVTVSEPEGNDSIGPVGNSVSVVGPPTISKAFGAPTLALGTSTSLTFTVGNPAANPATLTGVGFTDTLPAGLVVATPNGLTGSCGGGTITAVAASNSVTLAGATLAAGASCIFSVDVTAVAVGTQNNSVTVTATGPAALTGNTATASVLVLNPTDLAITKTHVGNFTHGGTGLYTITVSNAVGSFPSSGLVTVKDTLPGVMTPMGVNAPGWTCTWTMTQVTCTRSNSLAGGTSYPAIGLTVRVSPFGAGRWINIAKVSGGGDTFNGNNLATDPTIVN